jgi:hypothetical protein
MIAQEMVPDVCMVTGNWLKTTHTYPLPIQEYEATRRSTKSLFRYELLTMKVYHGTSLSRWKKIKLGGLSPRGEIGQSNWTHSIESNPDTVYLTDAYAMHFAMASLDTEKLEKDHAVIIEIETDRLDQHQLVADEDALEQVSRNMGRGQDGLPVDWDMLKRTRYYKSQVREFADKGLGFEWSMQMLGTAGFVGKISPEAFTRVAIIDIAKQRALAWEYMNCQVSVMNYKFLGEKYRALTQILFDPTHTNPLSVDFCSPNTVVSSRDGLEIVVFD